MHQLAVVLVAFSITAGGARPASASCAATKLREVELVISSCKPVDTAKTRPGYAGVVVVGTESGGKAAMTAWIPAAEGVDCTSLKAKTIISAMVGHACCDGDPNPPCLLRFSEILSKVKVVPAKKQAARP